MYKKKTSPPPLQLPSETCECTPVEAFTDVSSLQADGVGASCGVVDGRAGGLGHSPFIPHLLPIVAAPESHCNIIILGYGDWLLLEGMNKRNNVNTMQFIFFMFIYFNS